MGLYMVELVLIQYISTRGQARTNIMLYCVRTKNGVEIFFSNDSNIKHDLNVLGSLFLQGDEKTKMYLEQGSFSKMFQVAKSRRVNLEKELGKTGYIRPRFPSCQGISRLLRIYLL
jgi:hypothetical protein